MIGGIEIDKLILTETKQLTLLNFNSIAEEIKTLTKSILDNRWKIAEKLFYIKNHWDEYKKQDDFLYKTFQQFIKDYYGWSRAEAHTYIEAHKFKELLTEKCTSARTYETLDISTAEKLNVLSKIDENESISIIEDNPDITLKEVNEEIKQVRRKKISDEGKKIDVKKLNIDLRLGDFIEVLDDIPDNSIDLILTDPPYPIEFIDEWDKLGQFAKCKLKPNGFCISYSGHKNIYKVMEKMNKYLDYYWMMALIHTGHTQLITFNNIEANWKPILIYQKGFKKHDKNIVDIIKGTGRNKDNHDWEQSMNELQQIIETFTYENELIVDPFAGSGTTLIISKNLKRNCIGAEVDKDTFNIAKKRIKDELGNF